MQTSISEVPIFKSISGLVWMFTGQLAAANRRTTSPK
jgi:hypothetical protein